MKQNRKELLEIAQRLIPGTNEGSYLEGIETIVFKKNIIHSYNDNISISIIKETNLEGAVNAKDFYKLLQKLQAEEIEIVQQEKNWKIKSGSTEIILNLKEDLITDYIDSIGIDNVKFMDLPDNFIEGLKLCKIPGNSSYLRGVFVQDNNMISSDEIRLSFYTLSKKMQTFWIDDSFIFELLKINENIIKYGICENWVHFKTENDMIFSCKRNEDEQYPVDKLLQYKKIFIKQDTDEENELPEGFDMVLDRVGVLYTDIEGFQSIDFHIEKDKIILIGENVNGKIKDKIKFKKAFKQEINLKFKQDFNFMKEAIKKCSLFYIRNDNDIIDIVFYDNNNFVHIVRTISE